MRESTMPRSALAEPLRYAQSARLGRVPMGCGPAYAAVTPPGGNLDPAWHFRGLLRPCFARLLTSFVGQPDACGAGAFPLGEAVAA